MTGEFVIFGRAVNFLIHLTQVFCPNPTNSIFRPPVRKQFFNCEVRIFPIIFDIYRHQTIFTMILESLRRRPVFTVDILHPVRANHPEDPTLARYLFRLAFRRGSCHVNSFGYNSAES
jgi:hypothetical protein